MVLKKQLEIEAIFFVLIGAVVGYFFVAVQTKQSPLFTPATFSSEAASPTLTPTPFIPTSTSSSQISSDGTKKVILNVTQNQNNKLYEISVDDGGPVIFSKTLNADEAISIPFNTWSSDNRYFFIQENTKSMVNIYVFKATGEPFAEGEPYHNLTTAFLAKAGDNSFDAATGWAEGHLIIVNTKRSDGTQGSSFWYEVPSNTMIQLGTKF